MDNPRLIFKPPRRLPGDLQTLPTYPLMFACPMNAQVRSRIISNEPCLLEEANSLPYKSHWQFRDNESDGTIHPDFVDLRGGPSNLKNVTEYYPHLTPFRSLYEQDEKPKSLFGQLQSQRPVLLLELDKRGLIRGLSWLQHNLGGILGGLVTKQCDYVVKLNKEKKLNEEWMKKFGRKYFYIVDDMPQMTAKFGHRAAE